MQGVISPYGREEVLGWKIQRPRRHEPLKYSLERNGNGHGLECVVHERTDTRTRVSQEGLCLVGSPSTWVKCMEKEVKILRRLLNKKRYLWARN